MVAFSVGGFVVEWELKKNWKMGETKPNRNEKNEWKTISLRPSILTFTFIQCEKRT